MRQVLDLWGDYRVPVDSQNRSPYGDLRAALRLASTEQLLEATKASTFGDVMAALPQGAQSTPLVVPLADGESISPQAIGSSTTDLVYTPVTPCRIIDTRSGVAPYTGLIGPNSGNHFYVTGTDYSAQGGVAASCGIPSSPKPAAVVINVASTAQTGLGNLRVIQTGGGTPNVALVNYQPGVNISNAAIATSYTGSGAEIYIYSSNSQSHAVVDILGYFSSPAATALDQTVVVGTGVACSNGSSCTAYSGTCPAGYTLTGGGPGLNVFAGGVSWVWNAPPIGDGTEWLCQCVNQSGGSITITCRGVCNRIPGH